MVSVSIATGRTAGRKSRTLNDARPCALADHSEQGHPARGRVQRLHQIAMTEEPEGPLVVCFFPAARPREVVDYHGAARSGCSADARPPAPPGERAGGNV